MSDQDLSLLGQAQSAITQCCRLLGEQKTNEILAVIDQARESETADVMMKAREALEELRQAFEVDDSYLCLRSARAIENLADIVSELIEWNN